MRTMEKTSDVLRKRKDKITDLQNSGINLFPNGFTVKHTVRDIRQAVETAADSLTEDEPVFVAAGRMMAINKFGSPYLIKSGFETHLLFAAFFYYLQ